jgi:chemotaxis signal transduction protein
MSSKHVKEELSSYLTDLLGETADNSKEPVIQPATEADLPETLSGAANADDMVSNKSENNNANESNTDYPLKTKEKDKPDEPFINKEQTPQAIEEKRPAQTTETEKAEIEKTVENTDLSLPDTASVHEHKSPSTYPPAEVSPVPTEQNTEVNKVEANTIVTTSYEQHKKRLEKMLQQVTALDSKPKILEGDSKNGAIGEKNLAEDNLETTGLSQEVKDKLGPTTADIDFSIAEAADYQALPPISSEWLENGRPNWAQERFDILLIEVNGLQLAVPLVALGQIQPLEDDLTPLFGQSDWFMGLQKTAIGNIKTVNTAKFVMPERYQDEHDYKYVVSINGLAWGLAVDSIHQPISIDPDEIRWRVKRENRPWMAGTVKDHMCVLLDIPSMGEILQEQDKNHT